MLILPIQCQFKERLMARDGRCLATGRDGFRHLVGCHIVPMNRPDVSIPLPLAYMSLTYVPLEPIDHTKTARRRRYQIY